MSSSTMALLTCVLNEHSFLYHFIYYYQLIGFDHIYILKDKNQPDIIIDKSLFTIKITVLPLLYPPNIKGFTYIQYWNNNFMIKNIIKEDWILNCDIDEYLYLHGKTIKEYIEDIQLKNNNQIGQFQFPWLCIEHIGRLTPNIFDTMLENNWYTNDQVKAIVKRELFIKSVDNHHFIIKKQNNNINYFTYHYNRRVNKVKKRYPKYINPQYYKTNPFMIHFHSRGLNNIFTKILTYKYKGKSGPMERQKLINSINSKQFSALKNNNKFQIIKEHKRYPQIQKYELNLPEFNSPYLINIENEEEFLLNLLKKNNINIVSYYELLNRVKIILN